MKAIVERAPFPLPGRQSRESVKHVLCVLRRLVIVNAALPEFCGRREIVKSLARGDIRAQARAMGRFGERWLCNILRADDKETSSHLGHAVSGREQDFGGSAISQAP